jgi:hypothetical protein
MARVVLCGRELVVRGSDVLLYDGAREEEGGVALPALVVPLLQEYHAAPLAHQALGCHTKEFYRCNSAQILRGPSMRYSRASFFYRNQTADYANFLIFANDAQHTLKNVKLTLSIR